MQALIGKRVDVTFQKPVRLYLPVLLRMGRVIAAIGTVREVDDFWITFDVEQIQLHPDDVVNEGDDGLCVFGTTLVYRIDDIVSIATTSMRPPR